MPIILLYHDVVDPGRDDESGFPGAGAARYKMTRVEFGAHLDAIAGSGARPPVTLPEAVRAGPGGAGPLLTFDDGGSSAFTEIAGALEARGWRGHFFVTAGRVGTVGFVDAGQVRELDRRGHLIGTHSQTHPPRMSTLGPAALLAEWRESREALSEVLGRAVTTGSVPGGSYSRAVAEAAARAGVEYLFTSEPTARARRVGGCTVLGRYTLYRGTSPAEAGALAAGKAAPRLAQAVSWNVRKLAKALAGPGYDRARSAILAARYGGRPRRPPGGAAAPGDLA